MKVSVYRFWNQWIDVNNTYITPNLSTTASASLVKTHIQRTGYKIFFSMIHIHTYNFSNHVIFDGSNKNNNGGNMGELHLQDKIKLAQMLSEYFHFLTRLAIFVLQEFLFVSTLNKNMQKLLKLLQNISTKFNPL